MNCHELQHVLQELATTAAMSTIIVKYLYAHDAHDVFAELSNTGMLNHNKAPEQNGDLPNKMLNVICTNGNCESHAHAAVHER